MQKTLGSLLFFVVAFSLQANEIDFYYGEKFCTLQVARDDDFKTKLRAVLTQYHIRREGLPDLIVNECPEDANCVRYKVLTYNEARQKLFTELHLNETADHELSIRDVYCPKDFTNADFKAGQAAISRDHVPFHEVLNTEHTWPRSRFNPAYRNESNSDLHHLFPADNKLNNVRGNYEFAMVNPESKKVKKSSHLRCGDKDAESLIGEAILEKTGISDESEIAKAERNPYFQPPAEHRGNVARVLFYFAVRYELNISPIEEYYLRQWHEEDPVDQQEKDRNDRIAQIQNVRNPFIDHPEWVSRISDF